LFNKLVKTVLSKGLVTSRVSEQLIAPIENIMFFDEADGDKKLS